MAGERKVPVPPLREGRHGGFWWADRSTRAPRLGVALTVRRATHEAAFLLPGSHVLVQLLTPRGGRDDHPLRAVGVSLDVTERRTLEMQYQQAQKVEAVGRLAGGIAHDFNNLLTAILGYCDLLLLDLGEQEPRRADLTEIQKAGTRAAALTTQLLAFSRKQIIEPTVIDLSAVVAETLPMQARLIGEDVRVAVKLASEAEKIYADRGQVDKWS